MKFLENESLDIDILQLKLPKRKEPKNLIKHNSFYDVDETSIRLERKGGYISGMGIYNAFSDETQSS
ncbi:MAG: hypothetical protein FWH49_01585 [Clostridiales bacterium]|nr:hypothetical protein [Clostridiales bacterium]